jgi:hypothetical protein
MDIMMMPVIRITEKTWERMKKYARPLEDSPDNVINLGLDALDERGTPARPARAKAGSKPMAGRRGNKLPQKEFRLPLLETLRDLGGKSAVKIVRERLEPKLAPRLSEADYSPVSGGEPRWWNAVCWQRLDLVKEGLLKGDSERGVWELSQRGRQFLASRPAATRRRDDGRLKGKSQVNTKTEIPTLVGKSLGIFQKDKNNLSGDPITKEKIGSIIEEITGKKLHDGALSDIKEDMLRRQKEGQGVKRLSNSADVWSLEPWFVADSE